MARPKHLTAGDVRFLAGVGRHDPLAQVNEVSELIDQITQAAEAAGIEPDLSELHDLEDAVVDDPQRLDEIRSGLRAMLGQIGRGEYVGRDERADWNAEMSREIRALKEDMGMEGDTPITDEEVNTDE
jgi:hypothetical protein